MKKFSNDLALVFLLFLTTGCASKLERTLNPIPIFPSSDKAMPTSTIDCDNLKNKEMPSQTQAFYETTQCIYERRFDERELQRRMPDFVFQGISLSNQTCTEFFDNIENRRIETDYAQSNVSTGLSAVTAILAYTASHIRATFNVATGLTVSNAWFQNYKANYIFNGVEKVHKKINEVRSELKTLMINKSKSVTGGYATFAEAADDLRQYSDVCSHKVIQEIVEKSLDQVKVTVYATNLAESPNQLNEKEASEVMNTIYLLATQNGITQKINETEFIRLYLLTTALPDQQSYYVKAMNDIDPSIVQYFTSLTKTADWNSIAERIKRIGILRKYSSNLKEERSALEALVKAKRKAELTSPDKLSSGPGTLLGSNQTADSSLQQQSKEINDAKERFSEITSRPTFSKKDNFIDFNYNVIPK